VSLRNKVRLFEPPGISKEVQGCAVVRIRIPMIHEEVELSEVGSQMAEEA